MDKIDVRNLTGKCLVSMPRTDDGFADSVIYICSHGNDGAMGFIINKPIKEFSFQDLAVELPFGFQDLTSAPDLYNGGPLERAKGFILHSDEYKIADSLNTGGGIMVSSSLEVLRDIASGCGPRRSIIALGYAGWAPQQLETEIADNRWLITQATPDLVLSPDDANKWERAISSLGICKDNFTPFFGHS